MIRLHLDEHVPMSIAEALRRRGIDVTTTFESGLAGATDEQQLQHATSDERVIFTLDPDFLRLHAAGRLHAGIAFCRPSQRSNGEIIRKLVALASRGAEELHGRVEFV